MQPKIFWQLSINLLKQPSMHLPKNVYILGIGGYGMSALARWFNYQGATVFGHDRAASAITHQLSKEGIDIHFQADIAAIPTAITHNPLDSLIIYSSAISNSHPILAYLTAHNYKVCKRTVVFNELTQEHFTWAIAGTHGKTTTTSLAAHILAYSKKNIAAFLGGIAKNYKANLVLQQCNNQEPTTMVIEADEFDRFFLSLHPNIAMVTTLDPDHLDTYLDTQGLIQGFNAFLDLIPQNGLAILHKQVINQLYPKPTYQPKILTYALTNAPIHAANIRIRQGIFYFDYVSEEAIIQDIPLAIPGYHNIENALAVITACLFAKLDPETIRQGIATFQGVLRRFDYIIQRDDLVLIDDYAHHPVEIAALLKAARQLYPKKSIALVFRPNLYTRTRDLAAEFARVLDLADCIFLLDIYPDREQPIAGISSEIIFKQLTIAKKYLCTPHTLLTCLADYGKPEVLINVGSGGTSQLVEPIKQFLLDHWG
jgi:UDP-N-acetylmuramate--alanine ligase